jgi:hypothetical protein
MRQLLLRQAVGHPDRAVLLHSEPLSQTQQLLRQPARHIRQDQIGQDVAGPTQSPGQYPQQSFGYLGVPGDPRSSPKDSPAPRMVKKLSCPSGERRPTLPFPEMIT